MYITPNTKEVTGYIPISRAKDKEGHFIVGEFMDSPSKANPCLCVKVAIPESMWTALALTTVVVDTDVTIEGGTRVVGKPVVENVTL